MWWSACQKSHLFALSRHDLQLNVSVIICFFFQVAVNCRTGAPPPSPHSIPFKNNEQIAALPTCSVLSHLKTSHLGMKQHPILQVVTQKRNKLSSVCWKYNFIFPHFLSSPYIFSRVLSHPHFFPPTGKYFWFCFSP